MDRKQPGPEDTENSITRSIRRASRSITKRYPHFCSIVHQLTPSCVSLVVAVNAWFVALSEHDPSRHWQPTREVGCLRWSPLEDNPRKLYGRMTLGGRCHGFVILRDALRVLRVRLVSVPSAEVNFRTNAYLPAFSIFQNAIPPACWPTSAAPTRVSVCRSYTSTLPGAAPTPSLLTKA